jgi:hypothetical protein
MDIISCFGEREVLIQKAFLLTHMFLAGNLCIAFTADIWLTTTTLLCVLHYLQLHQPCSENAQRIDPFARLWVCVLVCA